MHGTVRATNRDKTGSSQPGTPPRLALWKLFTWVPPARQSKGSKGKGGSSEILHIGSNKYIFICIHPYIWICIYFFNVHIYMNMNVSVFYVLLAFEWSPSLSPLRLPCFGLLVRHSPRLWNHLFSLPTSSLSLSHLQTAATFNSVTPLVKNLWKVLDETLINLLCPECRIQVSFWPRSPSLVWRPAMSHPPVLLYSTLYCSHPATQTFLSSPSREPSPSIPQITGSMGC